MFSRNPTRVRFRHVRSVDVAMVAKVWFAREESFFIISEIHEHQVHKNLVGPIYGPGCCDSTGR